MESSMNSASIEPGQAAPHFSLPAHDGRTVSLHDLKGRKVVLYFYPKDNTPGCTTEGRDFAALYPQFQAAGAEVLGVSRDSLKSHGNFAQKYAFPFPLLSDADGTVCKDYAVLKEKRMFGKLGFGIERSTFVIDRDGRLAHVERKVKVGGHAARILDIVKNLP